VDTTGGGFAAGPLKYFIFIDNTQKWSWNTNATTITQWWGTTTYPNGTHSVTVRVTDSAGKTVTSWLPEPLRWDAERPVEARGCVLPRDDHGQLCNGVIIVVLLHAREQFVVDVAAGVRDRVGVFERDLLRVAEEWALRVVAE
jgi:hypothetical protein